MLVSGSIKELVTKCDLRRNNNCMREHVEVVKDLQYRKLVSVFNMDLAVAM